MACNIPLPFRRGIPVIGLVLFTIFNQSAVAVTATLTPVKDNTLYESGTGALSNAKGTFFFVGRNGPSGGRIAMRGLLAFDIAAANIPSGSTITSVSLTLNMSISKSTGTGTVSLHRVLNDWGEGSSDAPSGEAKGGTAASGDATWIHRFRSTASWTSPGGDFNPTASAQISVGGNGSYTWGSSATMIDDVIGWMADPATNFGWLLKGDETAGALTAKRFNSRESSLNRPTLTIIYTAPVTDNAPTVSNPIADVNVSEDAAPTVVSLAAVFQDAENDPIAKSIVGNNNSGLVTPAIDGDTLTLTYTANQSGSAEITVRATANGKTVDDVFAVTVAAVDDAPTVSNPIADVSVVEDAAPTVINLASVFQDAENDPIVKSIVGNSNSGLVTPVIDGDTLTLTYTANQIGSAEITVRATANGKTADDVFTVTVIGTPAIAVLGADDEPIAHGDTIPSVTDGTDFGAVGQNDPPPASTFSIQNTGTADLTINSITPPDHFSLSTAPTVPATVTPSQSVSFTITLDSTAATGAFSGNITIENDDADESPFIFGIMAEVVPQAFIAATKDNTLYESEDGSLSNGSGAALYVGKTGPGGSNKVRRALVMFPVADHVPAGSTVDAVVLELFQVQASQFSAAQTLDLHELLHDWGEGGSNGSSGGATAQTGDATWRHTFYNTGSWSNAGGDFAATASGSIESPTTSDVIVVRSSASTASMVADVADWLDNPSGNFGWLLKNRDESSNQTTRAFNSRENAADRPRLIVRYTPPGSAQPEIEVTGNGMVIVGGAATASTGDGTAFGHTVSGGAGVTRAFTVKNWGEANLVLGAVTVPAGFAVVNELNTTVAPGASITCAIRLDTAVVGVRSGPISFTTNDGNENPFTFTVAGTVASPLGNFDIDGNGSVDALTDGILILRYMYGFTGPALTAGALGTGATRTDPAQIETLLDSLAPPP